MNYITNKDHISTAALHDPNYLSHGLSWGKHRYVRREGSPGNYRYIYPEDLRNAGQNLVSGAKNLVSRAGNAVSSAARNARQGLERAAGVPQKKSLQRANAEHDKWVGRYREGFTRGNMRNLDYSQRNAERSYENVRRAEKEYNKTPLGKISNLGSTIKDFPSDVSYEVGSFLKSSVGVGGRKNVLNASGKYEAAMSKLDQVEFNYNNSGGGVTLSDLLSARRDADAAYAAYRDSCTNYGKTFLGSIDKLLKTGYTEVQLVNFKKK